MTPTRSKFSLRQWLFGIFGVILALLAIGSVSITAHNNHRQQGLIECGTKAVQQTVEGLVARDVASNNTAKATLIITDAREKVILSLADVVAGNSGARVTLAQNLHEYETAIGTYRDTLLASISARTAYPLPDASCLRAALDQASGGGNRG